MDRTMIGTLSMHTGQEVKIQGWLQTVRDQKRMQFLVVRDISGSVQVAFEKNSDPELAERISSLPVESTVTVIGKVFANPVVRLGGLEIVLSQLTIESRADALLPLDPFTANLPAADTRMDWRYLDLRRKEQMLLFKVETQVEHAMREYWVSQNFLEIHSPKLMGSPSESGAELFELPYFETKAYLAQSPQFYKQMAMAAGFERIFEIGPVFRADPSFTSRHMTEFTSVDVEMSWIDSHQDLMTFIEDWLISICRSIQQKYGEEIASTFGQQIIIPEKPFPQVTMMQAVQVLKKLGHELPPEKKGDIDPAGERLLGGVGAP